MKRAVALLGAQEVDDILAKEGKIEVRGSLRPCEAHALETQWGSWVTRTRVDADRSQTSLKLLQAEQTYGQFW